MGRTSAEYKLAPDLCIWVCGYPVVMDAWILSRYDRTWRTWNGWGISLFFCWALGSIWLGLGNTLGAESSFLYILDIAAAGGR